MDNKMLTIEDVLNADTYMSVTLKYALAQKLAPLCIEKVKVTYNGIAGEMPLPDMFREDQLKKSLFLRGVALHYYLHKTVGGKVASDLADLLCPADEYDAWGNLHNQMERMKSSAATRDKAYDILTDFRDFERKLNAEIFAIIQTQNDPCARIMAMMGEQTTPEALEGLKEQVEAVSGLMDELKAKKEVKADE